MFVALGIQIQWACGILSSVDCSVLPYFSTLPHKQGGERGTAVAQWLRCCVTNRKDAGSIPAGVNGFFVGIKSFRSHYGPEVDSACNTNEYL